MVLASPSIFAFNAFAFAWSAGLAIFQKSILKCFYESISWSVAEYLGSQIVFGAQRLDVVVGGRPSADRQLKSSFVFCVGDWVIGHRSPTRKGIGHRTQKARPKKRAPVRPMLLPRTHSLDLCVRCPPFSCVSQNLNPSFFLELEKATFELIDRLTGWSIDWLIDIRNEFRLGRENCNQVSIVQSRPEQNRQWHFEQM